MSDMSGAVASPKPDIQSVTLDDLRAALAAGWRDFRTAPAFGLFFSSVYVLGGLALVYFGAGTVAWTLMLSLGFPLIAPFAAVGLYEVSRRMERGEALSWPGVLGVVLREKDRQLPWAGAIIVFAFLFWTFLSHMVFALFMGLSVMTNISSSWEVFFTSNGLAMIGTELVLGGCFAFLLFGLTVVSFPLMLDKEIDFMTSMLLSLETVRRNLAVMLSWAAIIAALLFAGMLPAFLGLFVVLPVLGHATWHLYRRALSTP
ncbi:putative membrane protein [Rhodovulum iodosum]|uniref:Membrane protein n=1 Tax=Rhodovulum iodosum TaxID=68291 RepID=A0ABV3XYS1_9RHOB|nr:DUF2189 domain-containing protein [Rhodovulum robiginosum]RSK38167.1 DUF2189 domain-containing protein [Rhodovulum robiginosum]